MSLVKEFLTKRAGEFFTGAFTEVGRQLIPKLSTFFGDKITSFFNKEKKQKLLKEQQKIQAEYYAKASQKGWRTDILLVLYMLGFI
jgi:hypothetical protein